MSGGRREGRRARRRRSTGGSVIVKDFAKRRALGPRPRTPADPSRGRRLPLARRRRRGAAPSSGASTRWRWRSSGSMGERLAFASLPPGDGLRCIVELRGDPRRDPRARGHPQRPARPRERPASPGRRAGRRRFRRSDTPASRRARAPALLSPPRRGRRSGVPQVEGDDRPGLVHAGGRGLPPPLRAMAGAGGRSISSAGRQTRGWHERSSRPVDISVVAPVFNERDNLTPLVDELLAVLRATPRHVRDRAGRRREPGRFVRRRSTRSPRRIPRCAGSTSRRTAVRRRRSTPASRRARRRRRDHRRGPPERPARHPLAAAGARRARRRGRDPHGAARRHRPPRGRRRSRTPCATASPGTTSSTPGARSRRSAWMRCARSSSGTGCTASCRP